MQVVGTETVNQPTAFKGTPAEPAPEPATLSELIEQEIASGRTKTKSEAVLARDDGGDDGEFSDDGLEYTVNDQGGDDAEPKALVPDDEEPAAKRPDSFSRTKASLVKSEKALAAANRQLRELEAENRRLQEHRQSQEEPSDVMDAVRQTVSRRLGTAIDDPRVVDELSRIAQDLLLEGLDPSALDEKTSAELRRAREDRIRAREERARHQKIEERFAQLERERNEALWTADQQRTRATVEGRIVQFKDRLPFLTAQTDVDPTSAVIEMADALIDGGHVQLFGPRDAVALIDRCASQLDAYYHGQARLLAARLPGGNQLSPKQDQQVASPKKQTPRKRTVTGSGGGGRGAPSGAQQQQGEPEPESFDEFLQSEKRRYAALEQKRRARR